MKKLILTTLATTLISTSTWAMDPVQQQDINEWFELAIPMVELANACKYDNRRVFHSKVLAIGYHKSGDPSDDMTKELVNLQYNLTKIKVISDPLMKTSRYVKKYPNKANVKEACANHKHTIDTLIATAKKKGF